MVVIEKLNFTVEYESDIMFAYSPNILTVIKGSSSIMPISLVVTEITTNTSIVFEYATTALLQLDISRFLRMFDGDIKITVRMGQEEATITPYVIKGSKGKLEPIERVHYIRQFQGYPISLDFLINKTSTVYLTKPYSELPPTIIGELSIKSASGYGLEKFQQVPEIDESIVIYADGYIFKQGEWKASLIAYNITPVCTPKKPLYLRWVAKNGFTWYWCFSIHEINTKTDERETFGRLPINEGEVVNEWQSYRSLEIQKTAKIYTTEVTDEEYKVVKTLADAPIVDAYDEESNTWYRVRVATSTTTDVKGHLKDVDFEIEFAPEITAYG